MARAIGWLVAFVWFSGIAAAAETEVLPGTKLLTAEGDLSLENLEQFDRYFSQDGLTSPRRVLKYWSRDFSSHEKYVESSKESRARFKRIIGAVDERLGPSEPELVGTLTRPALLAESESVRYYAVRWQVFSGVYAEGLLLEPRDTKRARVVVVPDADQTPEQLAGLARGLPEESQLARRLAEAGCRVLVPTIIDRNSTWSGNPAIRMTNQTHREFIYRQAYFMGRHILGYEVQKVLAAVDYFTMPTTASDATSKLPVGVAGWGEGGLIALYSAAIDTRITSTLVSGYFGPREGLWTEPVYRNVYGLLTQFSDAELASLVAPRLLTIEACKGPEVPGPPPSINGRNDAATGALTTPALATVKAEVERVRELFKQLGIETNLKLVESGDGQGPAGSPGTLEAFCSGLGIKLRVEKPADVKPPGVRHKVDVTARMKRQFEQLVDYTQRLAAESPKRRAEYWAKADFTSVDKWQETTKPYRETLWKDIIGKIEPVKPPPNARTRLIYDTPKWKGYEVLIDVWSGITAYGILLVPKDLKPDEQRPVVVAQHGRAGRPQDVCNPKEDTRAYHSFGAKLADEGFIVFAPQNLFIGEEKYRQLQRKANALGLTFFAPMVRQHEQILKWLAELPFVDAQRIGFYGLSYGGKSAMLIPAVLEDYALSICSGDFNEEVWKHVSVQDRYSFMFTNEHDHSEFDFGERFNYAEIAGLIAPRPFMVERGHKDGVAPDEWVAYEYAKVRRRYVELGIPERTEIEFFYGMHEIHLQGTLAFLKRHLKWDGK